MEMEKEMATHSSILAWKIPWTKDPGRLQSMGSQRVRHDRMTSLLSNKDRPKDYHTKSDKDKYHMIPLTCGIFKK